MAREGDAELVEAIRRGHEAGAVSMHVHYRRARKVEGFREALVEQVGARAVTVRDHFMKGAFAALFVWFAAAQIFLLQEIEITLMGSPVTLSMLTFLLLLLALVLFYRDRIKPVQGAPMHRAALSDPELFGRLWLGGAVALMLREGRDRICQSPRDDWRQFVRRTLMLQG
ncbi:MAG: hypothetical protein ACMVY4_14160 [Minwuia sp.]|uniref:hypothetical protein n=1 Tax=Minwuia sp. TaxID=2493630 RepID=UPI003A8A5DBE